MILLKSFQILHFVSHLLFVLGFLKITKAQQLLNPAPLVRTVLDEKFTFILDPFKKTSLKLLGSTGVNTQIHRMNLRMGKLQKSFGKSAKFLCDTKNGRSSIQPNSVHKLRPGDIDIIAAMGDSLTAGSGIMAINFLQVNIENRGISWSIGGQGNWREFLTLPNILKEYNPNLYGYSVTDSFSTDRITKFNVAELGAMSRDMPYQAQILYKRMKSDPNVNMTNDWKLVTILIGANDFCSDMCYYNDPKQVLKAHENDLIKTLRILRDTIPRLMVNIVPPPNVYWLALLREKPKQCYYTNLLECPCLVGWRSKYVNFYTKIMNDWQKKDIEIAKMDEFNTENFTVNLQPFTLSIKVPNTKENKLDFSYLAPDCFHLSQKSQARAANALWNNMFQSDDEKYIDWRREFEIFKCPTEERPYIVTRENSRKH